MSGLSRLLTSLSVQCEVRVRHGMQSVEACKRILITKNARSLVYIGVWLWLGRWQVGKGGHHD